MDATTTDLILQLKQDADDLEVTSIEKGYSQAESDFWDYITKKGKRTVYAYAFRGWDCEYIRPPYQLKVSSATFMFQGNPSLKIVEKAYFDFSKLSSTAVNDMLQACSSLVTFEDVGMGAMTNYSYLFSSCSSLKTIECLRFSEKTTTATSCFTNCSALENIIIEGEICISLSFSDSSKLSTASIISIIEHLSNTTGKTLTLNTTAKNNMVFPHTSAQSSVTYNSWDELIATKPNWSFATLTS